MTPRMWTPSAETGSKRELVTAWSPGVWRLRLSSSRTVRAGIVDRSGSPEVLRSRVRFAGGYVEAEQVHGASLAAVERSSSPPDAVSGCDALVTQTPDLGLVIRSADCLPIFLWDPIRRVVGVAHAGWRGVARQLPGRLVAFVQRHYRSRPRELWFAIGPSVRACCYEVGPEFEKPFGPFLQRQGGRLTCDLVACAMQQLIRAGVAAGRILDTGSCTACETDRWFSLRKEGERGGRLLSFIGLSASAAG